MATSGQFDLLRSVSLPSVRRQKFAPSTVVLVADGFVITPKIVRELASMLGGIEIVPLQNRRVPGAAGAWNTGLEFLATKRFDGFVTVIDDDDEWDDHHLAVNRDATRRTNANVVISGLRILRDQVLLERAIPKDFTDRMFLIGNPGWQGSNTFVAMRAMEAVGGFRDGLTSANDRDLAVRLLRWPGVRVAYTREWTATWHLSSKRQTLSSPRSEAKLRGLRWFWQIYGSEMQPAEVEKFFERAEDLFRIKREEVLSDPHDHPPHCEPHGDLFS
jgi:hypothetical protein